MQQRNQFELGLSPKTQSWNHREVLQYSFSHLAYSGAPNKRAECLFDHEEILHPSSSYWGVNNTT